MRPKGGGKPRAYDYVRLKGVQWRMSGHADRDHVSSASLSLFKTESQTSWLERTFQRRECIQFIASPKDKNRCGCGRLYDRHNYLKEKPVPVPMPVPTLTPTSPPLTSPPPPSSPLVWEIERHTQLLSTDAFGTIEFQGGPHPIKAQYIRLSHDTPADLVLQLLQKQWALGLPKLLISVHGGIANFDLQPKLKRVFHKGLFKAAKTTGAWVVTGGTNTGVMHHVGEALGDTLTQARHNIVSIGIAPWGVVHKRGDLIGRDIVTPYHAISSPKSLNVVLNSNHSHFLLVDNGTVGKYGCEVGFRRKLEKCVSQQKIMTGSGIKSYRTPMVCLVLEGGTNIIRTVFECVTDKPPVPVVVCDGSGRAADILAFTHKYAQDDGTMPDGLKEQLILAIEKTFQYSRAQANNLFIELMLCVIKKELITVFRLTEESQDIDLAILTALLKGQTLNAADQLSLTLAWNRVDIAKTHIFVYGQEWPEKALEQAMLEALANDRVDFIQLLLENGVSMQKWLTIARLEDLYNIGLKSIPPKSSPIRSTQNQDPSSTLRFLIRENKKHIPLGYRYTLFDIGQVMEKLLGGAYRAGYCRKKFRSKYNAVMKKGTTLGSILCDMPLLNVQPQVFAHNELFSYPFHHLLIWAVLLRRQKMAKFMWHHGEEAMAKALVACKLYKSMAHEAAQDDLEIDISDELRGFAKEFGQLAVELLEHCYGVDDDLTQHLLTYELPTWSEQTNLALAVSASNRDFLAHTSCQILLTEMWMGGLRMRKYTSIKVILGILFFPSIVWLEFKSKEELQLMPQTVAEHIQDLESDSDTSSDGSRQSLPSHIPLSLSERDPASDSGYLPATKKSSRLRWGKRIYEFYTAPVTKFWVHTMAYFVFVLIHTYVVLTRMYAWPTWQEYFVIAYIFTAAIEKARELAVSEPKKLSQKLSVFFSDVWNICDTIAILLFVVGLALRVVPATRGQGRVFYCVNIIFWYTRTLELFSVNKYLGPYVMMIGKMMKDMLQFIVILLVVMMAFGVVRQSIMYPDEEPQWRLARNVFLKPYFMIYGEVYAGEIDPACSDDPDSELEQCVPGRWITPAVMAIYLIVANILLVNLLIAVFNNTFQKVNAISTQVWKFQRYSLVLEYESKPILPPPLILLSHAYLLAKYIWRRCHGRREYFDNGLKLFLDSDEVERLHDFEEECMDSYFREKDQLLQNSTNERIRSTAQCVESMTLRLDEMGVKENTIKLSLQGLDQRLGKLEELTTQNAQCMRALLGHLDIQQPLEVGAKGVRFNRSAASAAAASMTPLDSPTFDSALYRRRRGGRKRAPPPMLPPITPVITPLHSEYTSITDGIDTSCMNLASPCGSPCTPRRHPLPSAAEAGDNGGSVRDSESDDDDDDDDVQREVEQLKDAEECERAQMESIVRSRMRQISMTETESVIDIVLHVMRHTTVPPSRATSSCSSCSSGAGGERKRRSAKSVKRVRSEPTFCFDEPHTPDRPKRCHSNHSLQQTAHGRRSPWGTPRAARATPPKVVNGNPARHLAEDSDSCFC